jgi:hypothetical protein
MAPPNPKSRPRSTPPGPPAPRRRPTLELPFNDEEVQPLRADDPRPQRVAQYPTNGRRPARKAEEAIPTSIYDVSQHDEEFQPSYDKDVSDPGYKPAFLYVERGPGTGQLVPVRQGAMVVGRASVSELRLQHSSISRRHAQLTRLGERFYLKDLGSQNGTFVNRTRIATEVEVHPGDEISIGNALLKMRGPVQGIEAPPTDNFRQSSRPRRRRSSVVRIGVVGGVVGFGLAGVFTFAVLKMTRGPSYKELPASANAAHTAAPGPAMNEKDTDAVNARIKRAMDEASAKEQALRASAKPEAEEPKSKAAASAPSAAPSGKHLTATRVASRGSHGSSAADDSPAPAKSGHDPEVLSRYEEGDLPGALSLAKDQGDRDLTNKLQRFSSAYEAAKGALAAKDGTGAVRNFTAALKADEQLSKGSPGKLGIEVRKELSSLYTLVGLKHLENDDSDDAAKAFKLAVQFDPENSKARQQLAKLGGEAPAPAAAAPKKKIDDAWGDDKPAPKAKASAKAKPANGRSAIDAAFGD